MKHRKKSFFLVFRSTMLVLTILLLLPLAALGESEPKEKHYYYEGYDIAVVSNPDAKDRLHLRTKAHGSAKSLGKYYNGTIVALLPDNKDDAEWLHVRIGETQGYMEAKYLTFGDAAAQIISAQPEVTVDNQAGTGLNLRTGQSIDSGVIRLLENGTQVTVLGVSEDWIHVQVGYDIGYIRITGTSPRVPYTYGTPGVANAQVTSRVSRAPLYAEFTDRFWDGGNPDEPVVKFLKTGTKVTVVGAKGDYYQIQYQGHTYWISRFDLDFIANGSGNTSINQARITANCSAYAEPSADARLVCNLFVGEVFPLQKIQNGYAQIEVDGAAVWVNLSNIERISEEK